MREPVLLHRVLQRARDMRLPDEIVERLRPVLARENLVTHRPNLMLRNVRENRKREPAKTSAPYRNS